jgi:hypothetical protein
VIGKANFTAETRRRGEERNLHHGDTEARRRAGVAANERERREWEAAFASVNNNGSI